MIVGLRQKQVEGDKKPTRYYSKNQEKTVAKNIGGSTTPNSGATMFSKGDITVDSLLLVECKTKTKDSDSMSIKKEWLEKNAKEALFMGKRFNLLAFNFGPNQKNYYILDEDLFYEFLDFLKEKYNAN